MSNKDDPQVLIADLCERFTNIFQEIKEIKQKKESFLQENQELSYLINEEIQKHQETIAQFQAELVDLQEIKLKEAEILEESAGKPKEIQAIVAEIENQKLMIALLEKKKREIIESCREVLKEKRELVGKIERFSKEIEDFKEKTEKNNEFSRELQEKLGEFEGKIAELNKNNEKFIGNLLKNEEILKETLEKKLKKEDEHRVISSEFRESLKKNSNISKTLQEIEKEISRNSEDLQTKIQRLEVLLKMNANLSNKLLKLEENSVFLEEIREKNKQLQHFNEISQEKLEILTSQAVNFDFKVQIKKLLGNMTNKVKELGPNFAKIARISGNFNRNFEGNSDKIEKNASFSADVEEIVKENVYFEEFIKSLENRKLELNEKIFENKKNLREKEEKLRNLKEILCSNRIDRENLKKKIEFTEERVQNIMKKNVF